MKLLSSTLTSLYSFEYYDDYYVDSDYWNWMNYGSVQPLYPSNSDMGSVSITSQDAVALASGESFEVFYAMALGANEQTMLSNIAEAEQKYAAWFAAVGDIKPSGNIFSLGQNYPNPVNSSTTITYQLPDDGFVSLKVYDATGNEVASLVNTEQTPGSYAIEYNAENLAGGMYFYTLRFNEQLKSNKLFVIR